jgi:hypothetical protein
VCRAWIEKRRPSRAAAAPAMLACEKKLPGGTICRRPANTPEVAPRARQTTGSTRYASASTPAPPSSPLVPSGRGDTRYPLPGADVPGAQYPLRPGIEPDNRFRATRLSVLTSPGTHGDYQLAPALGKRMMPEWKGAEHDAFSRRALHYHYTTAPCAAPARLPVHKHDRSSVCRLFLVRLNGDRRALCPRYYLYADGRGLVPAGYPLCPGTSRRPSGSGQSWSRSVSQLASWMRVSSSR